MWADILWLVAGLAVLVVGGEFLVKGAVGIALKARVSTLVIGMTVVSFGTSAPELLVSVEAALDGHSGISIGNVVGSNIANLALVLAITVLIFPILVDKNTKRLDWPVMMGASLLFFFFMLDGELARWEGGVLLGLLVVFTYYLISNSRKKKREVEEDAEDQKPQSFPKAMLFLGLGLVGLYFGAEWLLKGAIGIAVSSGMSEEVIAVTIVAFGTSVPELVTSAVAAYRKETDISVGNLIGSNLFNICTVLGITSLVRPITDHEQYDGILNWDIFWMLGISLLVFPLMLIGKKLGRWQGVLLLGSYIAYIWILLDRTVLA